MLTHRQAQTLRFIKDYAQLYDGAGPSFEELKVELGLKSKSQVHCIVKALEERGFIRRIPYKARAIEVVREG